MKLLANLAGHFWLRLGFIVAERRQPSMLAGDALVDEINARWGTKA